MYKRTTIVMTVFLLVTNGCSAPVVPPLVSTRQEVKPPAIASPTSLPSPVPTNTATPSPTLTPTPRPIGWVTLDVAHSPVPRTGHTMTMLSDGKVLMFGGINDGGKALGDTWILGLETNPKRLALNDGVQLTLHNYVNGQRSDRFQIDSSHFPAPQFAEPASPSLADWTPITSPDSPSARQGLSMAQLPDGRVLLFGGVDDQGAWFNDLHAFVVDHQWSTMRSAITPANALPSERANHNAWVRAQKMYIQGGYITSTVASRRSTFYEDLWLYDLLSNRWQQLQKPPGFISPTAYPIIHDDKAYLVDPHRFPYNGNTIYFYDMNKEQWGQIKLPGIVPPDVSNRSYYMMVQVGSNAYMLGGEIWNPATHTATYTAQVWVLDLIKLTWTQLKDMPYSIVKGEAVYDPLQKRIIVWGGMQSEGVHVPSNKILINYLER